MRTAATALLVIAAITIAGGCGSSSGGGKDATLNTAYSQDPTGGLDPDQFYDIEGESAMLGVYEGLLRYKPGTTQLAPSLATSWTVSRDGKTYTFKLRPNVKFHDGTPLTSAAVKQAFERRIKLKGGPSYMLEPVASISTPNPQTFVVRLKRPSSPFLDFMASMYGPKIISPKALRDHDGGDGAKAYLQSHAVGTGPLRLQSYKPGQALVLTRFDGYWGKPAASKTVRIAINPSIGDQLLQLRAGQLDVLPHGVSASQVKALQGGDLEVTTPRALIRTMLTLNVAKPPFNDLANRKAVAAALDLPATAERIYPSIGAAPKTALPEGLLPAASNPPIPPAPSARVTGPTDITISYNRAESDLRRLAESLQQQLGAAGFTVKLRADSGATEFAFANDPKGAPEAVLGTYNPDAAHPAGWLDSVYKTGGGLNLLGFSDPELDRQLAAAGATADSAAADRLYAAAAQRAIASYASIPIVDLPDIVVARRGVSGFAHVPAYVWAIDLASTKK